MDRRWQRTKEKNQLGNVVVVVCARCTVQYVETSPCAPLEGADYSFYDRFTGKIDGGPEEGTDTSLLLADLRFSSAVEPGLELVDVVVNATRRALVGALGEPGWRSIPRLMVHRKEPYIKFICLREGADVIRHPLYGQIVRQFFSSGGRLMLTPRFVRAALAES